jgi:hypothetical protein
MVFHQKISLNEADEKPDAWDGVVSERLKVLFPRIGT